MIKDRFSHLQISRQRRYQLRKQAAGMCTICGKRALPCTVIVSKYPKKWFPESDRIGYCKNCHKKSRARGAKTARKPEHRRRVKLWYLRNREKAKKYFTIYNRLRAEGKI